MVSLFQPQNFVVAFYKKPIVEVAFEKCCSEKYYKIYNKTRTMEFQNGLHCRCFPLILMAILRVDF